MTNWARSTAIAVTGLAGLLTLLVGVLLLPGAQPQPGSPGHGIDAGFWAAVMLVLAGGVLCVGFVRRLDSRVALATGAAVIVVIGVVLVGRQLTGREVPSARTAQATVAQGFGVHASGVTCTRLHGQYWDYRCSWVDGGRQSDSLRFDGARIVDDARAHG